MEAPAVDRIEDSGIPNETWKTETGWVVIASAGRLLPQYRNVRGGYSGILYNIKTSGTWVWQPDADEILVLQDLAACRGGPVARPFGIANPNAILKRSKPEGPPELD